jgi:Ribosomal protein S3, C-terminal domain
MVDKYKKIKKRTKIRVKHLIKPIQIFYELTRTLYNKKLRNQEEKEKKRDGALKDILAEKMTNSLQYFTSKNIALWIHLKALNLNRSKKIRKNIKNILRKNLIKLRKYKEEKFYRDGIEMLLICATIRRPSALLAQFLAVQLKTLKKHNFFFKFIKDALKLFNTNTLSKIKRIKIKIKGRLNARPKAKSRVLKIGKDVSVVRIRSKIDYSEKTAFTSNGTLGIKVWIHEFSN